MTNPNLDTRSRRFLPPTRVVWHSAGAENADILLANNWGQALAQAVPACELKGQGAAVLLDFGRELHGSVQLVVGPLASNKPVRARLRLGESVSEAMGEPNNDHANHDFELRLCSMSAQPYGESGFRFARLDLLEEGNVSLVAMRAITLEHEPAVVGEFRCSDERLNEIWRVGKETVRLCLQDYIWDGIKRDRLVWLGDLHPEVAVVLRTFGALDIVPNSLDWVRDHTPLPQWMNGIGSYSMWWVILQHDWWLHTGDIAYLEAQRAYLQGLLPELMAQIQPDGEVEWRGWTFLDWPSSPNEPAVLAGLHALLAWSLDCGEKLCQSLGETELAAQCQAAIEVLKQHAPALPPSESAAHAGNKQMAALLVLAGMADAQTANDQVLSQAPLEGLSTFYGYYTLLARAQAGDMTGALDVIRTYWGTMLDLGATSFWEHFELAWAQNAGRIDELPAEGKVDVHRDKGDYCYVGLRHSFCHGWAAGPTAFLSQYVLGFEPLEPGAKKVRVRPHLGDLSWAEGSFPTPLGSVQVRHEKNAAGEVVSQIEAPSGITVVR